MSTIVEWLTKTFGKDCVLTQAEASVRVASNWGQNENLECFALLRRKNDRRSIKNATPSTIIPDFEMMCLLIPSAMPQIQFLFSLS
jgi:hypothetical protein